MCIYSQLKHCSSALSIAIPLAGNQVEAIVDLNRFELCGIVFGQTLLKDSGRNTPSCSYWFAKAPT